MTVSMKSDTEDIKTITGIIGALHTEGHQGPVEQDFIGNHPHGTDVSEFIHDRCGSLVKFLQYGRSITYTILHSLTRVQWYNNVQRVRNKNKPMYTPIDLYVSH
jgi:hypothetical protein